MLARRLTQLLAGLAVYGLAVALMIRAGTGLNPWDVLHQGLAARLPFSFGVTVILTGLLVLLLWVPLREKPGLGTLCNVVLIGVFADLGLALIPELHGLVGRTLALAASVLAIGLATAAYIGADFGPGPRDGLMTGLARRTGWPVRRVRTLLELTVLASGWLLGGTVGIGTVVYALAIGPIIQAALPVMAVSRTTRSGPPGPDGRSDREPRDPQPRLRTEGAIE